MTAEWADDIEELLKKLSITTRTYGKYYPVKSEPTKDPEQRCPVIEVCKHTVREDHYKQWCIAGCHKWGNCSHLPTEERRKYRNKYFKKPKDWEKKEIAEKL